MLVSTLTVPTPGVGPAALLREHGIDVVVHAQSVVHSYVLLCDGAALAHADVRATIPMAPGVDSLNVAAAAARAGGSASSLGSGLPETTGAFKDGVAQGFKLISIRPDSIYSKIGIVNGDVIDLATARDALSGGGAYGIPFAVEGIFFFLEAIFIAIYIYGWKRLRPWPHFWTGVPIMPTATSAPSTRRSTIAAPLGIGER